MREETKAAHFRAELLVWLCYALYLMSLFFSGIPSDFSDHTPSRNASYSLKQHGKPLASRMFGLSMRWKWRCGAVELPE